MAISARRASLTKNLMSGLQCPVSGLRCVKHQDKSLTLEWSKFGPAGAIFVLHSGAQEKYRGPNTSFTVSDLKPDTEYPFRVAAGETSGMQFMFSTTGPKQRGTALAEKHDDEKRQRHQQRLQRTKECLTCIEAIEEFFDKGRENPASTQPALKLVSGPATADVGGSWRLTCSSCNVEWKCDLIEDGSLFLSKYIWTRQAGGEAIQFDAWLKRIGLAASSTPSSSSSSSAASSSAPASTSSASSTASNHQPSPADRRAKVTACLECVDSITLWYHNGYINPNLAQSKALKKIDGPNELTLNSLWRFLCTACGARWNCWVEESSLCLPKHHWARLVTDDGARPDAKDSKEGKESKVNPTPKDADSFDSWLTRIGLEKSHKPQAQAQAQTQAQAQARPGDAKAAAANNNNNSNTAAAGQQAAKANARQQRRKRLQEQKKDVCLACVEPIEDWYDTGKTVPRDVAELSVGVVKAVSGPLTAQLDASWVLNCTKCNTTWECQLKDGAFMPKYFWYRGPPGQANRCSFDDWCAQNKL